MLKGAAAQAAEAGVAAGDEQGQAASALQTALQADPALIHTVSSVRLCFRVSGFEASDNRPPQCHGDGGIGTRLGHSGGTSSCRCTRDDAED